MLRDKIIKLIKPLLPSNAELKIIESNKNDISISWKLNNSPQRPNKRSNPIQLHLTDEFIEDYCDGNEEEKERLLEWCLNLVKRELDIYEPNHSRQINEISPIKIWNIPTKI